MDIVMKKRITYGLLAALMVCGCQEEELNLNVSEPKTFTAIIEDNYSGETTKTSLDENGNVLWKKGDQVSIFAGSTINEQYQITDDSDGKTSANLNRVSAPDFVAGSEIGNNVAYYPYSSSTAIAKSETGYKVSVVLPSTQTYAEASFANGAFPMAAITNSTDDVNLKFKNVLGGLKLQLKGTASVASISISGNADEILYGTANVSVSTTDVPSIVLTDASAKTITIDCGAGVQLNTETATPFIIALPPMTMVSGFTVIIKDTESKQMEIKTEKSQTITRSSLLRMPAVNYEGASEDIDYSQEPFTITSMGNTWISIQKKGSSDSIILEYKKSNGENWATYTIGAKIKLCDGENIQFRAGSEGNDIFSQVNNSFSSYYYISTEGNGTIKVSGNIMSLLDSALQKDSVSEGGFSNLFRQCTTLIDASNLKLPATTLSNLCYYQMFYGCTSLTEAPALPATTLAESCYSQMFQGCTSLIKAPDLPATTLTYSCYSQMFSGCESLTKAPELPATTLAESCYSRMFQGCTSLTEAPALPATTLAGSCYSGMFWGCMNLAEGPDLPATTLANYCYPQMFRGCTSLKEAPELPATTLAGSCYSQMFQGCTSLIKAPDLPATTLTYSCYSQMFSGCTSLTNAPELPATSLAVLCYNNMFSGCTSLTEAPDLPATTLAENCYSLMFWGCERLTKAPELPATTLTNYCYQYMFERCSNLNYVKALFTTKGNNSIDSWLEGVSSTGTFIISSNATPDKDFYGVPTGWAIEVVK